MKLLKRILVAIFFIPIILFLFFKGEITFIIFLSGLVTIMSFEFREMLRNKGIKIPLLFIPINVIIFVLLIKFDYELIFPIFLFSLLIFSGYDVFTNKIEGSLMRISSIMFGILYISFLLVSVYKLRQLEEGGNMMLVALISMIWFTDSSAYFIGSKYGKHKGIIKASPNKSLEGFVAGFVTAILFSIIIYFGKLVSLEQTIMLAISVGIFGQFGDVLESMFKRDMSVKDSSNFLPGHGGILDRFDSLLISAPILFMLIKLFSN